MHERSKAVKSPGNPVVQLARRFVIEANIAVWRLIIRRVYKPKRGEIPTFSVFFRGQVFRFSVNDIREHISRKLWRRRLFYERRMLAHAAHHVVGGTVAVDVGANIGNHTVFFAGVCGMSVVAFEPNHEAVAMLRENISLNRLTAMVTVETCALGHVTGHGEMDLVAANMGAAKVVKTAKGSIDIRTLDDVLGGLNVGLIKVDVEGMEREVILGGRRTIERCQPLLYIECKDVEAALTIHEELNKIGYLPSACFNASATVLFVPKARMLEELIELREW